MKYQVYYAVKVITGSSVKKKTQKDFGALFIGS